MSEYVMSEYAMAANGRHDRKFYTGMTIAAAIVVFIGFAPTFYLKPFFSASPLSLLVTVHGVIFTTWMAVFITQATLVAKGRTDLHRRLGIAAAVIAAAMVVVGVMTGIASTAHRVALVNGPAPLPFLAIPLFAIVTFGILAGTGLCLRRHSEAHKRLMVMATIAILGAAITRFPFPHTRLVTFVIVDIFILACVLYDVVSRRRVHPVYIWGGLAILASQSFQGAISRTDAWISFARWLTT